MSFPKNPSDHIREKIAFLSKLAHMVERESILKLHKKIKTLKTEALKRSLDWRAVGKQYAENCVMCKGEGQFHFCVNPYCVSDQELEKDDCLHFTPHEIECYKGIQEEYIAILNVVAEFAGSGAAKELIDQFMKGEPTLSHEDLN